MKHKLRFSVLNSFYIDHSIKPKSFGMRHAWLWADTWKQATGYKKLLLLFFHHASDQQLGKYKTADCSTTWSSLLKSLSWQQLQTYKMDWKSCKCNSSVLSGQTGLPEEGCTSFEMGVWGANRAFLNHDVPGFPSFGRCCGQLGTFPDHLGILVNSCQHWPAPLKSWGQCAFSLRNCSVKVWHTL